MNAHHNENYHLKVITKNDVKHLVIDSSRENYWGFTDREIDIVGLMADGLTADMVANKLHISPHTVKTHQKNMLKKSGCLNSIHLVARCIRKGMI